MRGRAVFCASAGVDCWCERGKLQRGRLDTGLGADVRAVVVPFCKALEMNSSTSIFLHVYSYT
jgi:hypothetical protein